MGKIKDEFFSGSNYERYEYYKKLMSYTGFHCSDLNGDEWEECRELEKTWGTKKCSSSRPILSAYEEEMWKKALEAQESSKHKKPVAIDWDNVEIDESLIEE